MLDDIWETAGFRAEVDRLAEAGTVELTEAEVSPYRAGAGVDARMLVLGVR